jgi:hypothetical protein
MLMMMMMMMMVMMMLMNDADVMMVMLLLLMIMMMIMIMMMLMMMMMMMTTTMMMMLMMMVMMMLITTTPHTLYQLQLVRCHAAALQRCGDACAGPAARCSRRHARSTAALHRTCKRAARVVLLAVACVTLAGSCS